MDVVRVVPETIHAHGRIGRRQIFFVHPDGRLVIGQRVKIAPDPVVDVAWHVHEVAGAANGPPQPVRVGLGRSGWSDAGTVMSLGRPRAALARSSSCGSNPADVGPHERTPPCSSILAGGDVVAAEMKEVVDLVVGGKETLCLPRRLEPLHCRSRRRVGWCEFSARLFNPLCCRCSTPGMISRFAAP